jgi:hypothetical protein
MSTETIQITVIRNATFGSAPAIDMSGKPNPLSFSIADGSQIFGRDLFVVTARPGDAAFFRALADRLEAHGQQGESE